MSAASAVDHTVGSRVQWVLRALVVAALVVDAVVHLRLASGYQQGSPDGIGAGNLFRIQALVALVAAGLVALRPTKGAYLLAFLTGLSAVAAVVLYRYVDVPAIGPLPAMYEPIWFFEKSLSAVAEAVAAAAAGLALRASSTKTT